MAMVNVGYKVNRVYRYSYILLTDYSIINKLIFMLRLTTRNGDLI